MNLSGDVILTVNHSDAESLLRCHYHGESIILMLNLSGGEGPPIKYVTLFLANFSPPPPATLFHPSRDPPRKYVTHFGPPPRFLVGLVKKFRTKVPCTN